MKKKKKLRRIIQDLETQAAFRKTVVLALAHAVKPSIGFRYHYSLHALNQGFTADEVQGIDDFFRWAAQRIHRPLGREELLDRFDKFVPTRKGKLDEILQVDRSDGEYGVWHKWAKVVLDVEAKSGGARDQDADELES